MLSGRPLLLVTGHFGNWEMGGYVLGLLGFTTHAIARTLDNPYLDDFLRGFRERTGQKVLAKNGDFDQIQAVLATGGVLATLGDQDAGSARPVRGLLRPAGLDAQGGGPAGPGVQRADAGDRHAARGRADALPCRGRGRDRPEEYQGRPDAMRAITQRFTAALERIAVATRSNTSGCTAAGNTSRPCARRNGRREKAVGLREQASCTP